MNQAASVSRFFWPTGKKYRERGELLREAFEIPDTSPLKDRKLRNMVEHFDEYLDDYIRSNFAGQYVPDYFGPSPPTDRGPLKLFRAYFTDVGHFEIFGESDSIEPLVTALIQLNEKVEGCLASGSRFPRPSKEKPQQDKPQPPTA